MARQKLSTFQRLQCGKLKPKDYKELQRRLQAEDPGLTVVHGNAAGIDVGSRSHFAAVPPERAEQPIREFGWWTAGLREMAAWLISCKIETVAVQATGVYWLALCDVLDQGRAEGMSGECAGDSRICPAGRRTYRSVSGCGSYTPMDCCAIPIGRRKPSERFGDLWRLRERWVQDNRPCAATDAKVNDGDESASQQYGE